MDGLTSESCYKGTVLQRNYRKMTIIIPLLNFMGKSFGSHNMTVLYPNSCYNEVCYKWTALYSNNENIFKSQRPRSYILV